MPAEVQTNSPLLLDFREAARLLGVGISTFYAMDRSGELGPQGIRLRRRRLWPREELAAWVRAGCPHREKWAAMSRNLEEGA
jgi:excisionase family DNA binding protein